MSMDLYDLWFKWLDINSVFAKRKICAKCYGCFLATHNMTSVSYLRRLLLFEEKESWLLFPIIENQLLVLGC